jgi:PAS domain S-box-containing protein
MKRRPRQEPDTLEELREKVKRLEETNHDLMGLTENCHDALAIVDGESTLLFANKAFERVLGIKREEAVGRTVRDRVRETGDDPGVSLKVIETRKPQTIIINKPDNRQVLSTGIPVFDEEGKLYRIYCNMRDITELNQLKERFEQSQLLVSKYLIELQDAKQSGTAHSGFIAHSKQMREIVEAVARIGHVDATVLMLGESGVGKGVIARAIHEAGPRSANGSFVKVNCGAIPGELLESELFGYETGAFTGASKEGKAGYFEIADKGTLMLDEIADLPLKLQVKLLSVIEDQEVVRLGGRRPKRVDVRIIAATNKDLLAMMKSDKFREDLYYRLNVVPFFIPPLRERREDVPFLLVYYSDMFNKKYSRHTRLSKETIDALTAYAWPGNVRELANLVERLVIVSEEQVIRPKHLPKEYCARSRAVMDDSSSVKPLREQVDKYELDLIKKVLAQSATIDQAAYRLGISRSTLIRRIRVMKKPFDDSSTDA